MSFESDFNEVVIEYINHIVKDDIEMSQDFSEQSGTPIEEIERNYRQTLIDRCNSVKPDIMLTEIYRYKFHEPVPEMTNCDMGTMQKIINSIKSGTPLSNK